MFTVAASGVAASIPARPRRVSRSTRVTLFIAAFALAGTAFGHAAVARADWDIEVYDNCLADHPSPDGPSLSEQHACCIESGGDWHTNKCWAPVENSSIGPQGTPTQVLRPPGSVQGPPPTAVNPGPANRR